MKNGHRQTARSELRRRSRNGFQAVARLLTVEEVAELLQVPKSWVYERTRRRALQQLPHLKLGKYLRFEESAVLEYLARQRVGATTNA